MSNALRHHGAGELEEAEAGFNRALEMVPDNARALHHLGIIAHQRGDNARAIDLIERSIGIDPNDPRAYSNLGAAAIALGRLEKAEESFRRATEIDPNLAEAHSNLAAVLADLGRKDEAIRSYREAQRAAPSVPRFVKRLADLYLEHHQYAEALDWFGRYLALAGDDAEVSNNMGYALEKLDRPAEAEAQYRKAAELAPDSPEILTNLGKILARLGRTEEAETWLERALEQHPEKWKVQLERAGSYLKSGQVERAVALYEQVSAAQPENAIVFNEYGAALSIIGRHHDAEPLFRKAIELNPAYTEAINNLGSSLLSQKRRADAIVWYKRALDSSPRHLAAHTNLCLALLHENHLDEAYLFAQGAVHLKDFAPHNFSNVNKVFRAACDFDAIEALGDLWDAMDRIRSTDFSANFLEMLVMADTEEKTSRLAGLHRRWYREFVQRAIHDPLPPPAPRPGGGKIRLGIVSSDLRAHSVARFVMPLLANYDRERFEIYCYSPTESPLDLVQQQIRGMVTAFRVLSTATDREFAEAIRADGIDILFELNGFTRDTRLHAVAYRPAPVQIYWLGYPFTTGVEEIDYILLDPHLKPENDSWLVEKPLLMPQSWVCIGDMHPEPISETLPVERNGFVTFGSFNNPYKFTRDIVALWCRIMHKVPGSRFLLVRPECRSMTLCANLTREFERNGITADRLFLVNNRATALSHLSYYDEIDITLDTYPLTGGTTTYDTLWMGVPVITRYGPSLHQRLSYSMLQNVGLDQLCVHTDDAYVELATALAGDVESLRFLRHNLRDSVQQSALGRAQDFARDFYALMDQLVDRHGLR